MLTFAECIPSILSWFTLAVILWLTVYGATTAMRALKVAADPEED